MKHVGDITKLNGAELPIVDIITGGSPCQDLSVAGKRAGLAGERSGLFMEQIRIIKEMRNECFRQIQLRGTDEHIRPRFMVWENVPGAFSSNGGEDFRAVLEEVCRVADQNAVIPKPTRWGGKWSTSGCILGSGEHGVYSVAWRVHDAQFWGVPQRRKRIALVADFGGDAAPEILFEREGVRGDSAESGEARQGTAGDTEGSAGETIKCLNGWDVQSKHIYPENGKAEALYSGECRGGGGESYVMQSDHVYCLQGNGIDRADTAGCNGKGWREDQSYTLNTIDRPAVCIGNGQADQTKINDVVGALNCMHDQQAILIGGGQYQA